MRSSLVVPAGALLLSLLLSLLAGCDQAPPERPSVEQIVHESELYRTNIESYMREHPTSPFNAEHPSGKPPAFTGLKWFPIDAEYYHRARLERHADPETVAVAGTGGEIRRQLRYGYFRLTIRGKEVKLNVYKFTPDEIRTHPNLARNLSIWFTDETTARETYGVGRYLEIGPERDDPDFAYTINFNSAHNPYCAYSSHYSCAIPTKDDHIPVAIRAGELKYDTGH